MDGTKYYYYGDKATAFLDFDPIVLTYFNGPREITIPAYFNNHPITSLNQSFYYPYYYDSEALKGITIKLYFSSDGYYQGEYADIGYIKNRHYLENLEYDGATILYYEDWH